MRSWLPSHEQQRGILIDCFCRTFIAYSHEQWLTSLDQQKCREHCFLHKWKQSVRLQRKILLNLHITIATGVLRLFQSTELDPWWSHIHLRGLIMGLNRPCVYCIVTCTTQLYLTSPTHSSLFCSHFTLSTTLPHTQAFFPTTPLCTLMICKWYFLSSCVPWEGNAVRLGRGGIEDQSFTQ